MSFAIRYAAVGPWHVVDLRDGSDVGYFSEYAHACDAVQAAQAAQAAGGTAAGRLMPWPPSR